MGFFQSLYEFAVPGAKQKRLAKEADIARRAQKREENAAAEAKLMPIFRLRVDAFKELNPENFADEYQAEVLIHSCLAAQDYLTASNYVTYDGFHSMMEPLMQAVHQTHGLDRGGNIHPWLVSDLVNSFLHDVKTRVIDKQGNILANPRLSSVMRTIHGNMDNGIPVQANKLLGEDPEFLTLKAPVDSKGQKHGYEVVRRQETGYIRETLYIHGVPCFESASELNGLRDISISATDKDGYKVTVLYRPDVDLSAYPFLVEIKENPQTELTTYMESNGKITSQFVIQDGKMGFLPQPVNALEFAKVFIPNTQKEAEKALDLEPQAQATKPVEKIKAHTPRFPRSPVRTHGDKDSSLKDRLTEMNRIGSDVVAKAKAKKKVALVKKSRTGRGHKSRRTASR